MCMKIQKQIRIYLLSVLCHYLFVVKMILKELKMWHHVID